MIRITVAQASARAISYTDKKGQAAKFFVQPVYAHTVDENGNPPLYPEKVELALDKDDHGQPKVWPAGEYQLHPSSVFVDRNGRLAISARGAPLKPAKSA